MSGHEDNTTHAACLCNRLEESLASRVDKLKRESWRDWCSFQGKGKVFAWTRHGKKGDKIEVFFLGPGETAKEASLRYSELSPKRKTLPRWLGFGGTIKVRDKVELGEVARFLTVVSYPLSIR